MSSIFYTLFEIKMWYFRYVTNVNMIVEKYESKSVCEGILEEREGSGYQLAWGSKNPCGLQIHRMVEIPTSGGHLVQPPC